MKKRNFYIDTDNVQEMSTEELKLHLNSTYGRLAQKKVAPRPKRRNDDIYEVDFMLLSASIVACIIGAIMLFGWGCGL